MSQRVLSRLAGVSNTTIASIERGRGTRGSSPVRPSPETLRLLARGLATDLVDATVDDRGADDVYLTLMHAAGYIVDTPPPEPDAVEAVPIDELTDEEVINELERRIGSRDVAVSLLATANDWRKLGPRSQRLILETVRFALGDDDSPPRSRGR